jgi:SAM-dependent methyltransferase
MSGRSSAEGRSTYWEDFYAGIPTDRIAPPSQFAAFVLQEAPQAGLVVEIGCGSGRDSIFFARQGLAVLGIDGSEVAIAKCKESAAQNNVPRTNFVCAVAGGPELDYSLDQFVPSDRNFSLLVYARFFLHAITDGEETGLLTSIARVTRPGDLVAFEYRTTRDSDLTKVTPGHFRRYVNPVELYTKAAESGFRVQYAVEGFGFAKYKHDDAYVARCILNKGA